MSLPENFRQSARMALPRVIEAALLESSDTRRRALRRVARRHGADRKAVLLEIFYPDSRGVNVFVGGASQPDMALKLVRRLGTPHTSSTAGEEADPDGFARGAHCRCAGPAPGT